MWSFESNPFTIHLFFSLCRLVCLAINKSTGMHLFAHYARLRADPEIQRGPKEKLMINLYEDMSLYIISWFIRTKQHSAKSLKTLLFITFIIFSLSRYTSFCFSTFLSAQVSVIQMDVKIYSFFTKTKGTSLLFFF